MVYIGIPPDGAITSTYMLALPMKILMVKVTGHEVMLQKKRENNVIRPVLCTVVALITVLVHCTLLSSIIDEPDT